MPTKASEAEGFLEKAIKLHSSAPSEYWNRLAECQWIQKKVERAVETLTTCPHVGNIQVSEGEERASEASTGRIVSNMAGRCNAIGSF